MNNDEDTDRGQLAHPPRAKQITALDRAARNSNPGKVIHTVLCAVDAETGLTLARADQPDLILVDIQLPGDTLLVKGELQAASAANPFHRTP